MKDQPPHLAPLIDCTKKANWNFTSLESAEAGTLNACIHWEYARESKIIRKLQSYWNEPFVSELPLYKRQSLFPFRSSRKDTLAHFGFPEKAWLDLSVESQSIAQRMFSQVAIYLHPTFNGVVDTIDYLEEQGRLLGFEDAPPPIRNKIISKGRYQTKTHFIEVRPEAFWLYSNDHIAKSILKIVNSIASQKGTVAKDLGLTADGRGRLRTNLYQSLVWLAALRLRHCYSTAKTNRLLAETYPRQNGLPGAPDLAKARLKAKQKFRSLFDWLPKPETPISYQPYREHPRK